MEFSLEKNNAFKFIYFPIKYSDITNPADKTPNTAMYSVSGVAQSGRAMQGSLRAGIRAQVAEIIRIRIVIRISCGGKNHGAYEHERCSEARIDSKPL